MLLFDDLIFHIVTNILLIDVFEIAIDMAGKSWPHAEEVLFRNCSERDRVWGLRFYILLTECFKEWGMYLKPTNKDNSESIFKRMYTDLAAKVPMCTLDLYYYADLERLADKDADFNRWRETVSQNPSNVFLQKFDTFHDKENLSNLPNVLVKKTEVKTALLSKQSTDRKLRSREELSNLVESLKHLDTKKSVSNKNANFAKIFEQIKLDRKLVMHEIFRHKLVVQKITQARQKYQDSVILNYDKIEDYLKSTDVSYKEVQDGLLKELDFANWLFDYIDSTYNADPLAGYNKFRHQICKALERIYGVYPRYYDQFLDKRAKVYQTIADYEKSENQHTDTKYVNRDHSIQAKGLNDSSLNHDTSLGQALKIVYSFSKDTNDPNTTEKASFPDTDNYINEYGHNFSKGDLLSLNKDNGNTTVRTFLKGAIAQEKAIIRSSNNNRLVKDPSPYDDFLANIKKVPVKITNTFKSYEEAIEAKHESSMNESRLRDLIRTKSRRESRDSMHQSKGSIKISFDRSINRPSEYIHDDLKETKIVNHKDEYGRDSSNKKLTSNAKHLDNSLHRASSLDIRSYSHDDTLQSLKKKNPRLSTSIFNKNGISIQKMDDVLIKKKMNALALENKTLQARKQKLERELSDLSIRERSISETPNDPLSTKKRTLRTITDFANNNSANIDPTRRPVALNCIIEEFNRKNEAHVALKAKYKDLMRKFSQKAVDSIQLNMQTSERMRDTVISECNMLSGNGGYMATGLGLRGQNTSRWIEFDMN